MRTVVQISDLHFGRVDPELLAPLREAIETLQPDVLVVSGDLTQRARESQFSDAAEYLQTLPVPQIVVPGNHDVPYYDVVRRFLSPLDRFHRYITDDAFPTYIDDEIAVVGVNTARSATFKGGRINVDQVREIEQRFHGLAEHVTRIVVTHHPFDVPPGGDESDVLGRAPMAMEEFAKAEVDVFLSGHLHHSNTGTTAHRYRIQGFAALVVQAGTATSTRERDETNAFNVLRIGDTDLTVETWRWEVDGKRFAKEGQAAYSYVHGTGWQAA
ncbi:metallophosphoesterase family protein [Cognatilysobacter lacus]|uniref:Metallophosphoesterase n=1 Tax=Cognatilysobacter lacus TaxID=1643323 RepID=A0A5D8Z0F9_9GAMM|nr:metallophosphoesterase family protein [Lysobacter lacus]TZF88150.1 metallophosphoesterase [Lysobacter lacus]